MSTHRLDTLLAYKQQREDAAAQALGRATAARATAEAEQTALSEAVETARRTLATHRAKMSDATETAADAVARQRFSARLAAAVDACIQRREAHEKAVLSPARQTEDQARKAHLAARQEREAIETVRDQQRAAELKVAERKQEAEQDDRPPRGNR